MSSLYVTSPSAPRLDQLVLQPDVCPAAVRDLVRRRYRPERRAAVRRAGKRQRPPAPVRDPQVARVVGGRPLDRRIERGGIGRRDDEAAASPDHLVHLRDGPIEVDQREREVLRLQIGLGHALVTAVHVPDRRDANAGEGVVRVSHHDEVRRRLHGQLLCEPREVLALQVGSSRTFRVVAPPEPRRPGGEEVGEVALRLVHSRRPSTRKHDRLGRRHPGVVADVGQHRRDDVVARSEPQRDQPEHVDLAHIQPGVAHVGFVGDRLAGPEPLRPVRPLVGDRPRDEVTDWELAAPRRLGVGRVEHAPVVAVGHHSPGVVGAPLHAQPPRGDELDRLPFSDVATEARVELRDLRRADCSVVVPGHEDDVVGQRLHELRERSRRTEQRGVCVEDLRHRGRLVRGWIRPHVEHVTQQHDVADPLVVCGPTQRGGQVAVVHRGLVPAGRGAVADVDVTEDDRVGPAGHLQVTSASDLCTPESSIS